MTCGSKAIMFVPTWYCHYDLTLQDIPSCTNVPDDIISKDAIAVVTTECCKVRSRIVRELYVIVCHTR